MHFNQTKLAFAFLGVVCLAVGCAPGLAEPGESPGEQSPEQPIILQAGPDPVYMTCRITTIAPAATVPDTSPPPEPETSVVPSSPPPPEAPPPPEEALPPEAPPPEEVPPPPFRWNWPHRSNHPPFFPPGS